MIHRIRNILTAGVLAATASGAHAEVDPCLVGTWEPDFEDMAHVFAVQMGATSATASGIAFMEIAADGTLKMTFADLTFDVKMPDNPQMKVILTGVSDYEVETLESFIYLRDNVHDMSARAEVLGYSIAMSPSDFEPLVTNGNFMGEFWCNEASVSFQTERLGQIARRWFRVDAP